MFKLIASYPKSGNTYVRIFLAHYLRGETDLNKIGFPLFGSVSNFPLGIPDRRLLREFRGTRICKTHEKADSFSSAYINSAVYICRDIRDVVPSFARHMAISNDKAINSVSRENILKGTDKIYPQEIGSWSSNILSWMAQKSFPVFFIRYETLVSAPEYGFRKMLKFLSLSIDEEKLKSSLQFSAFQNLKEKEQLMLDSSKQDVKIKAFKEARGSTGKFFNVGKSGSYKEALTSEQIAEIERRHGHVMRLLGYV